MTEHHRRPRASAATQRRTRRQRRRRRAKVIGARRQRLSTATSRRCSDVDLDIPAQPGDRADRPVGLRQVDVPALPQPDERHHPICRVTGTITLDGRTSTIRGIDVVRAARPRRHGVPEAEPVPEVDLRQRRLRPAHPRPRRAPRPSSTRSCRARCSAPGLWDEVKDRLQRARHRPLRRPAAAPVHRPRDRRQSRSAS